MKDLLEKQIGTIFIQVELLTGSISLLGDLDRFFQFYR